MSTAIRHLEQQGMQSLMAHAVALGDAARRRYGSMNWKTLLRLIEDRSVVRFPAYIAFAAEPLRKGEFAAAIPVGQHPRDGYQLVVHPYFEDRLADLPCLVAYHLVVVNYGEVATSEEAECFAAHLLGMARDEYYERICALADELEVATAAPGKGT
jgi:hypothetical protein